MEVKLFHISTFGLPYVFLWLSFLYKISASIKPPIDIVFAAFWTVFFISSIAKIHKKRHVIDEMFTYFHLIIGGVCACYSSYLTHVNVQDKYVSIVVLFVHLLFLYTYVYHVKRFIDPYLSINEYLQVADEIIQSLEEEDELTQQEMTI